MPTGGGYMSASIQPDQSAIPLSGATNDAEPDVPVHRSLPHVIWVKLRRFLAEALEEERKLYEKCPYGWWL
jgi:hypothetical protein